MMLESDYPYRAQSDNDKCSYDASKAVFKNVGMVQEKNLDNDDLKAIVSKQPVAVGIYTNTKFQFYKEGILTEEFLDCSNPVEIVNHGVVIVGYGKAEDNQWCNEYWLMRNTWGPKWGEAGFFKLCMDGAGSDQIPYGICQLNRFPTYPTMDFEPIDYDLLQ